jgi:hypothetical protein
MIEISDEGPAISARSVYHRHDQLAINPACIVTTLCGWGCGYLTSLRTKADRSGGPDGNCLRHRQANECAGTH